MVPWKAASGSPFHQGLKPVRQSVGRSEKKVAPHTSAAWEREPERECQLISERAV